jgi:hypothetical protein
LREYGAWRKSAVTGAASRSRPATAFRAYEPAGGRRAGFCRLEHVIAEVHVVLVRHRGEHRIPDGFCDVKHLAAKAGGRWQ